jgi:hypothetical protein
MAKVTGGATAVRAVTRIVAKTAKGRALRVGFLENATYPNGTPVGMVAAIQEFGAPSVGIPPRPFFRNMVAKNKGQWGAQAKQAMQMTDNDTDKALGLMGEVIAGQLRQSIVDTNAPKLSPTTLMLRKMRAQNPALEVNRTVVAEARRRVAAGMSTSGVSIKPLVDTGHLLNSIDYEVVKP